MHQNLCEGSQLSFWQLNLFTFTDSVGCILVSLFIQGGFFLFWKHTLSWKHIRLRFPFFFVSDMSHLVREGVSFFFFFYKVFFPQQKPFSCVVPQKNSQSAIHSAKMKMEKKKKERKKGKENTSIWGNCEDSWSARCCTFLQRPATSSRGID